MSEAAVSDSSALISQDFLACDGPRCSKRNPQLKCDRCRGYFYCSRNCQKADWTNGPHRESCVDFTEKTKQNYFGQVDLVQAVSNKCGYCEREPPQGTVILDPCGHAFCYSCLKDWELKVAKDTNEQEIMGCPTCRKTKIPSVEMVLVDRASKLAAEARRVGTTEAERQQDWELALQTIEPIPASPASSPNKDWFLDEPVLIQASIQKAEYQLESGNRRVSLELWDALYDLKKQEILLKLEQQLNRAMDANNNNLVDRLTTRISFVQEHGLDGESIGWLDEAGKQQVLKIWAGQAAAHKALEEWEPALQFYQLLLEKKDYLTREEQAKYALGRSQCLRETGNAQSALVAAGEAIRVDRYQHGSHKALALALKKLGNMEEARSVMNRAVYYEEPWNLENREANENYFEDLCIEIRLEEERKQKEAAFMEMWGPILEAARATPSDEAISWTEVKRKTYDMFGAVEMVDDTKEDEQREATEQKLEAAMAAALKVDQGDVSEATLDEEGKVEETTNVASAEHTIEATKQQVASISIEDDEDDVFEDAVEDIVPLHSFENIKVTSKVVKWLKHSDSKFRGLLQEKLRRLSEGPHGRKYVKPLVGCKTRIFETYLEQKSGQRILWTQYDNESILIWFVAKHKEVNRLMRLIDDSENRSSRPLASATMLAELDQDDTAGETSERILLDPLGDTPLKVYDISREDIDMLDSLAWQPPLHLTSEEREIVETRGTVLLLGRSGTGKTICICNRIDRDRRYAEDDPQFKQLFIARSNRICTYVEETVGAEYDKKGKKLSRTTYMTFARMVSTCEKEGDIPSSKFEKKVDFNRFKHEIVKDQGFEMDPLILWTQIRSFVKGSIEAVKAQRPLTKDEYLGIGTRRCRLSPDQREEAYAAFESYDKYMKNHKLWDDCDRIAALIRRVYGDPDLRHRLSYSRIYVDEVQDYTQAEVALFFLLGCHDGLFFAGDPAQSVVEGVEFRFEDLRSVAYELFPNDRKAIPNKPLTVNVNFRSHAGVLNVASAILERLFKVFPGSAKELKKDEGLFRGPRPGIFMNIQEDKLKDLVYKIDGVVLLTMYDSDVDRLQKLVGKKIIVLSIRDSKGLEFPDVIVVDFFKGLSREHQRVWRKLLQGKDDEEVMPEIETQLKQLYTAITRCSQRLFFAETVSVGERSDAGSAFVRFCTEKDPEKWTDRTEPIAIKQDVTDVKKMVKTNDEWSSTGIDYAMNAEAAEVLEREIYWLERALDCFEQGDNTKLGNKAKTHRASIDFRTRLVDMEVELEDVETMAADLLRQLIEDELKLEARKLSENVLPLLDDYTRNRLVESLLPHLPDLDA